MTQRDIHIDLYAPHQSRLGANLQLRVERLIPHAETIDGRRLLSVTAHLATKVAALLDRPDSLPGRKDRQEVLGLLRQPGASGTPAVIRQASARTPDEVTTLMAQAFVFLAGDASLNRQDRAQLRQVAQHWSRTAAGGLGSQTPPGPSTSPGIDI